MTTPTVAEMLDVAIRLANTGQRERARLVCERAVEAHPPHPAVQQLLAVLAMQSGRPEDAQRHAAHSLALRPDHAPTLAVAGEAALALRRFGEAAQALQRAVALAPTLVEAWFSLSLALQDLRRLDEAAAALERVLSLQPGRPDALVNLGIVRQDQGRLDDAMRAYGRAYRRHESTFGRIAHALATPGTGALWLDLDALKAALRAAV